MNNHEGKEQVIKNVIRYGVVAAISLLLTFPSMIIIKNIPGNSFKTELDYIATSILVLIMWFTLLSLCVWLANYLKHSKRLKNNPSDKNLQSAANREAKKFKTLAKILKWALIIACVYLIIISLISFTVFSGAARK